MANELMAVGLLLLLGFGGIVMTFNLTDNLMGFSIGLGFDEITGGISGFWIILLRIIIAPLLVAFSGFVIYNILKGGL